MDLNEENLSSLQLLENDSTNLNILKLAHSFLLARNQSENWKNPFIFPLTPDQPPLKAAFM